MAITNVPQLCDALIEARTTREYILTSGILPTTTEDGLTDLDEDNFLDGNVQAVNDWIAAQEGSVYTQISVLEVNAFLAAAQNSYGFVIRDAFKRRLGRLKQQQLLYKDRGVLDDQLRLVGTLVDPPMALQMVGGEA